MKHAKKYIGIIITAALVLQLAVPVSGSLAAAKPKLSAKTVNIEVGAQKKVKVKKAAGFKITVKSKNKAVATAKKKGKAAFVVKGVKAGKTTVTCVAKKGSKKVTLKCKVKVSEKAATQTPADQTPTNQTPANQTPANQNQANPQGSNDQGTQNQEQPTEPTEEPGPTPYVWHEPDPIGIELAYDVPAAYRETAQDAPRDKQGRIVNITYDTETYDQGNSVPMKKKANVYLPAGYDENEKYNVFYLMHGGNENENTWLVDNDYSGNKKMLDNLIANGEIEPLIVVTPTFYRPEGAPGTADLTDQFKYELRRDLIPYIESHYSTYAEGDVSEENLIRTRMHRSFAGLSMGSMTTYRAALYGNYDIFGWFGPYSGCAGGGGDQNAEVQKIVSTIENGIANGYELGFLYCGNGVRDMAHDEHVNIMKRAVQETDKLVEGANYAFIDLEYMDRSYGGHTGEHSMWSWHIHFYNCLRIFFTRE